MAEKIVKLTPTMKEVMVKIREGWAVGYSHGLNPHAWIQKNGVGRGGEAMHVRLDTFFALHDSGLIFRRAKKQEKYFAKTSI